VVPLPSGGQVEFFTGNSKQSQVACAPSQGKAIAQYFQPVDMPLSVELAILDILDDVPTTATSAPIATAAPTPVELSWLSGRMLTLAGKVVNADAGERHDTYRKAVRTVAGYCAGMGRTDMRDEVYTLLSSAHRDAKPEVTQYVLDATFDWAWDRGVTTPLLRPEPFPMGLPESQAVSVADIALTPGLVPYYDPFLTASKFIGSQEENKYITWQGTAWQWRRGRYHEVRPDELRAVVGGFTDNWFAINAEVEYSRIEDPDDRAKFKKRPASASTVQSVFQAFNSLTVAGEMDLPTMPGWINRVAIDWEPVETIALRNCLLNVRTSETRELTNRWFSRTRSNAEWHGPDAACPSWMQFVDSAFQGDLYSILLLQMWFGLCLTSDTSYQKILAMVGPPRSGKGTINRVLRAMIGDDSVVSLGLGDLGREFGLEKLIGTPVAVMPDVRFGARDNLSDAIERLLSISGEDEIRIARKYQSDWSGRLPTRLIMASNEMPRLPDAAAALPTRLLVLQFTESYVGREDGTLHDRLMAEMPGILAWAVQGYAELCKLGRFPDNTATVDAVEEAKEIGSPIHAFVNECLNVTYDESDGVELSALYHVYQAWCHEMGHKQATQLTLRKQILDLNPKLRIRRAGPKSGTRVRKIDGVTMKPHQFRSQFTP
jgi:putative DNA primase/helicase